MSHDFARKKPVMKPARQVPGWVWLFTGVLTGLFIAFLFYLAGMAPEAQKKVAAQKEQKHTKSVTPKTEKERRKDKPRFDFYTLLPKLEVIAPKDEQAIKLRQQKTESSRRHNKTYLLQTGSFQQPNDADRRRAELILLGLDVDIQTVEIRSGETWHRVMVGPYTNANTMHRAQDKLANNGIESLAIEVKTNN